MNPCSRATEEEGIRKALAKYCVIFGEQNWEELGSMSMEDATLSSRRGEVCGRGAIVEDLKGALDDFHGVLLTSNEIITVDGDSAQMISDFLGVDKNKVLAIGRYNDTLVKVKGEWLFARKRIELR